MAFFPRTSYLRPPFLIDLLDKLTYSWKGRKVRPIKADAYDSSVLEESMSVFFNTYFGFANVYMVYEFGLTT